MKGDPLPVEHHVARYCKPSEVDPESGQASSAAFEVQPGNADLSVNWLEQLHADRAQSVQAVRDCYIAKAFKLRKNGRFAVLNVGKSVAALKQVADGLAPTLEHEPLQKPADYCDDPSHSEYKRIPLPAASVAALLLLDEVAEIFPALP